MDIIKDCINYGKKNGWPPRKIIYEVFDKNRELYVIYTAFPDRGICRKNESKPSRMEGENIPR